MATDFVTADLLRQSSFFVGHDATCVIFALNFFKKQKFFPKNQNPVQFRPLVCKFKVPSRSGHKSPPFDSFVDNDSDVQHGKMIFTSIFWNKFYYLIGCTFFSQVFFASTDPFLEIIILGCTYLSRFTQLWMQILNFHFKLWDIQKRSLFQKRGAESLNGACAWLEIQGVQWMRKIHYARKYFDSFPGLVNCSNCAWLLNFSCFQLLSTLTTSYHPKVLDRQSCFS